MLDKIADAMADNFLSVLALAKARQRAGGTLQKKTDLQYQVERNIELVAEFATENELTEMRKAVALGDIGMATELIGKVIAREKRAA